MKSKRNKHFTKMLLLFIFLCFPAFGDASQHCEITGDCNSNLLASTTTENLSGCIIFTKRVQGARYATWHQNLTCKAYASCEELGMTLKNVWSSPVDCELCNVKGYCKGHQLLARTREDQVVDGI